MEFQVQSVYLIYIRLLVHVTLILIYPKSYTYYMLLIYSIIVLESSIFFCDNDIVTVTCNVMLTPNSKFKIENKWKWKWNRVHYLWFQYYISKLIKVDLVVFSFFLLFSFRNLAERIRYDIICDIYKCHKSIIYLLYITVI